MKKYGCLLLFMTLFGSCNLKNRISNSEQISTSEKQMKELIGVLIKDFNMHENVGSKLSNSEIKEVENELGLKLPSSYKLFLKEFCNGADWLYLNPIDDIKQNSFLNEYHNDVGETIELLGVKEYKVNSLLCLMTEDSNGGAWVWLTSDNTENGEWPLAYYSLIDKKLHYKVDNFIEWLSILTKCKNEVIRALDVENILGLG